MPRVRLACSILYVQVDDGARVAHARKAVAKRIGAEHECVYLRYEDEDILLSDDDVLQRDAVALVQMKVCDEHVSCCAAQCNE